MSLRRKLSPGFSRAVDYLLRSRAGVRHATGAPSDQDAVPCAARVSGSGLLIGRPEPIAHYLHLVAGLAGARENIVGAR